MPICNICGSFYSWNEKCSCQKSNAKSIFSDTIKFKSTCSWCNGTGKIWNPGINPWSNPGGKPIITPCPHCKG